MWQLCINVYQFDCYVISHSRIWTVKVMPALGTYNLYTSITPHLLWHTTSVFEISTKWHVGQTYSYPYHHSKIYRHGSRNLIPIVFRSSRNRWFCDLLSPAHTTNIKWSLFFMTSKHDCLIPVDFQVNRLSNLLKFVDDVYPH